MHLEVEMKRLIGPATLTFEDGSVFDGEARLKSIEPAGKGYVGTFKSKQVFHVIGNESLPVLSVEGVKFKVVVTRGGMEGVSTVETSGPPIK